MKIIMETHITERRRVIIEYSETAQGNEAPYTILSEQKATDTMLPWEICNGWRCCTMECAYTIEDAVKKYDERVATERRYEQLIKASREP